MKSNAVAILLGGLAVVIAATGTTYAVTATQVNIADPTTPANVARVDTSHHLLTTGATSPIAAYIGAYGFDLPAVFLVTSQTKAILAVTAVNVDNSRNRIEPNSDFQATLVKVEVGSSGTCNDSDRVVTSLSSYAASAGQSVAQSFTAPIAVKQDASKPYCLGFLLTSIDASAGSSLYPTYLGIDAYAVSGTYTGVGTYAQPSPAVPTDLHHG